MNTQLRLLDTNSPGTGNIQKDLWELADGIDWQEHSGKMEHRRLWLPGVGGHLDPGRARGVSDNGKEAARSGVAHEGPCTHQSRMEFMVFS